MQAAALDEMFHHGEASALRYHKALLLMEGLTLLLSERDDIISVGKCEPLARETSRQRPRPLSGFSSGVLARLS